VLTEVRIFNMADECRSVGDLPVVQLEPADRQTRHAHSTMRRPLVITGHGNDARSQAMKGNGRGAGFSMTAECCRRIVPSFHRFLSRPLRSQWVTRCKDSEINAGSFLLRVPLRSNTDSSYVRQLQRRCCIARLFISPVPGHVGLHRTNLHQERTGGA
jgi:hypothetical protein